jgi:hypothetical protein
MERSKAGRFINRGCATGSSLLTPITLGEYRSGKHIHNFRREEEADEFVRQVKDKRVQVHYDASNPEKSVILDRDLEVIVLLAPQYR